MVHPRPAVLELATVTDVFVLLATVLWLPVVIAVVAATWSWRRPPGDDGPAEPDDLPAPPGLRSAPPRRVRCAQSIESAFRLE
jgi:hypothetical protein